MSGSSSFGHVPAFFGLHVVLAIVLLSWPSSLSAEGKPGDLQIEKVQIAKLGWFGNEYEATITLRSLGVPGWLAFSLRQGNGRVTDFLPKQIWIPENFGAVLDPDEQAGWPVEKRFRFRVEGPADQASCRFAVWFMLIRREDCRGIEEDNYANVPCAHCRANGYHMQERLDDTGWFALSSLTWSNPRMAGAETGAATEPARGAEGGGRQTTGGDSRETLADREEASLIVRGLYHFEEGAGCVTRDDVGAHDLALSARGGCLWTRECRFGASAVEFTDGGGGAVSETLFDTPPRANSVEIWFKPGVTLDSGCGQTYYLIAIEGVRGQAATLRWDGNLHVLRFYLEAQGDYDKLDCSGPFLQGKWYQVVVSWGPSGMRLWSGNELVAQNSSHRYLTPSLGFAFRVGARGEGDACFRGAIDEVGVYAGEWEPGR